MSRRSGRGSAEPAIRPARAQNLCLRGDSENPMADLTARRDTTLSPRATQPDAAPPHNQVARRYGLALALVASAFAARLALAPALEGQSIYLFFLPTVLVAAG